MLTTSYHTHSRFCDGQGEIEDFVRTALAHGFTSFGASSHGTVPFPNTYAIKAAELDAYCAEVRRLGTAYADRITVLLGSEIDVIPRIHAHFMTTLVPRGFDYFIGSVHHLGDDPATGEPWEFDAGEDEFRRGLNDWYQGNIRRVVEDFYALERAVPGFVPGVAIAGHMDRIKKYNVDGRYFSEKAPWYRDAVEETLQHYAATEIIVELNTAGWRQMIQAPYPSPWIVRRCHELGIRMQINTDAHKTEHLVLDLDRGAAVLRDAGYREVWAWRAGAWVAEALA